MGRDAPEDMVDEERKRICWERRRTVFGIKVIGWVRVCNQDYVRWVHLAQFVLPSQPKGHPDFHPCGSRRTSVRNYSNK
jgi:hypothetical protein